MPLVRDWGCSGSRCLSRHLRLCPRQRSSWFALVEANQSTHPNPGQRRMARDGLCRHLWSSRILRRSAVLARWVSLPSCIFGDVCNRRFFLLHTPGRQLLVCMCLTRRRYSFGSLLGGMLSLRDSSRLGGGICPSASLPYHGSPSSLYSSSSRPLKRRAPQE